MIDLIYHLLFKLLYSAMNDFNLLIMILLYSLVGHGWLETYMTETGLEIKDLDREKCVNKFRLALGKFTFLKPST